MNQTKQIRAAARPARRGVVMVLFALLVIGFLAIAGMAIDLGLARLNQCHMQGAADSVSVEIVRERDWARIPLAEEDQFLRDLMRRTMSARLAAWRYLEGLPLTPAGGDEYGGGGAFLRYSQGLGELNWGRNLQQIGWSVPRLATNYQLETDGSGAFVSATPFNLNYGDIVSGTFKPVAANDDGNPFRMESASYDRLDFEPADVSVAPYAESVLVRMRRVGGGEFEGYPQVSTTGRPVPLLFSAGTSIRSTGPDIRQAGFRMRATSIATARRAVRVGLAVPEADMPQNASAAERAILRLGVTGLVLDARIWEWQDQQGSPFQMWQPRADGGDEVLLYIMSAAEGVQNMLFLHGPEPSTYYEEWDFGVLQPKAARSVGDAMVFPPPADAALTDPAHWRTDEGFVPLYRRRFAPPNIELRVVGFGRIRTELVVDDDTGAVVTNDNGYPLIRLIRLPNLMAESPWDPWVAPRNASARFDGNQTDDLPKALWDQYMAVWSELSRAVYAPALAR